MIRLSRQTAFEVHKDTFARDLDAQPFLHLYRQDPNGNSDAILIQGDNSPNKTTTRNSAFAPFWNNVLLGTENFYPERGLGLVNYHTGSTFQNLLSDPILPTINYKRATLYFNQGSLSDSSILGYTLGIYCLDRRGYKKYLLSMVDFKSDSNVIAKTPKYFESQIFNEGIDVEFIDVEYLLNSNDSEVQEVKELLFGTYRPDRIYIEYTPITSESIDEFDQNGYVFTSINTTNVNEQSLPISFIGSGVDLYNELSLVNDNRSLRSEIKHSKFNVADFLDTQKESEQSFDIKHIFSINVYDGDNTLIESYAQSIQNVGDIYDDVTYRPILDINADHAKIDCSVKIENIQTGLIYTIASAIVITPENISGFKTTPDFKLEGIQVHKVSNTVNRVVNEIVHRNETPEFITLERKIYVHAQQAESIVLLDGEFTAKLTLPEDMDVSGNPTFHLKIGTITMDSLREHPLMFRIPKEAYSNDHGNVYILLDEDGQVVTTGSLVRKSYPTQTTEPIKPIVPSNPIVDEVEPTKPTFSQNKPPSKFVKDTPKSVLDLSIGKFDSKTNKGSKLSFDFMKAKN